MGDLDDIVEMAVTEVEHAYEAREVETGEDTMRQVERQVMLRVLDTRCREHLYEMDYLQEGIHLRAMGQKDPLVEWQREGYDMFGQMMHSISQDFVRYVMHAQVTVAQQPAGEQAVSNMRYSAPDDQSAGSANMAAAARAE